MESVIGLILALGWVFFAAYVIKRRPLPKRRGQDMISREPARPEPDGRLGPVVVEDIND